MSSLLVVTGPPGSGKSTVTRLVAARFEQSVLIDGDAFFAFLGPGAIAPWLPEARAQNEIVTRAAAKATGQFASEGYFTVYDGVVGPWFLPTFAHATDVDVLDYAILMPMVDVCVERVATRTGHGFTDEDATRKMYNEFARAEIDERHVLRDPPNDPDAVADLIVAALPTRSLEHRVGREAHRGEHDEQ